MGGLSICTNDYLKPTVILEWSITARVFIEPRNVVRVRFTQTNNLVISPGLLLHKTQILSPCCPVPMSMIPLPQTRIERITHAPHSFLTRSILTGLANSELSDLTRENVRHRRTKNASDQPQSRNHRTRSNYIMYTRIYISSLTINLLTQDIP